LAAIQLFFSLLMYSQKMMIRHILAVLQFEITN